MSVLQWIVLVWAAPSVLFLAVVAVSEVVGVFREWGVADSPEPATAETVVSVDPEPSARVVPFPSTLRRVP